MLLFATATLLAPNLNAQTATKRAARMSSPAVSQTATANERGAEAQMMVRTGKTGHQISQSFSGVMSLSVNSTMRQATGNVEIYGNVIYSDKPEGSDKNAHLGIWKINEAGNFSEVYPTSLGGCYSAVCVDGVYHNYYVQSILGLTLPYYKAYDINTWEQVATPVTSVTAANIPYSLCTDGTNVYGQFHPSTTSWVLGKMDLNTNTYTAIGSCDAQFQAMAYGNDNFIYAITYAGDLYKISPADASATLIGATGVVPKYITGATVDKKSGRMFWTVSPADESGNLYEVNLTTGAATKLCSFEYNDEVAGIFIPFLADDKAPAAVTDLTPTFTNGSLSGTVAFKCPTTLYDGTAASGNITYKVLANGEQVATGSCAYGQQVTANVTVAQAGNYAIAVVLNNDKGDSPKTQTKLFIGKDTPKPTTVTIAYNNGKFNVNWTAATQTVNGGYMDLSKINYTVTRYPDATVVAQATTATSLEDPVAAPSSFTSYYYTVVVNCDGVSSAVAKSNTVGLGAYLPPYDETFETAASAADYTIIDVNNDGKTWAYSSSDKAMRATYHASNAMDDWMITPAFQLEAGKTYRFSFDTRNHSASAYPEILEVMMGNNNSVEAMTKTVIPETTLNGKVWITFEEFITPTESGTYYFGFHGKSAKNMFYLFVDNISISAPMDGGSPNMATDLTATADATGALKAVVKGKAPTTTLNGGNLASITKIDIARDGTLVKTLTGVAPGAEFTFNDDAVPTNGDHTWSITCSNDKGAGRTANVSGFVGFDAPSPVTNITTTETSTGKVHITWEAPTTDINGKPLTGQTIKYKLVKASATATVYAEEVTGTSFDYTVVEAGQEFFQVGVFAITDGGTSTGVAGPFLCVGFPYTLPYYESFEGKAANHVLGIQTINGASATWALQADGDLGINSVDNDGGYISCKTSTLDQCSMLFSGKIDLTSSENPAFSFYTYNITDGTNPDINELDVKIREVGQTDWTVLKHGTVNDLCGGDTSVWKPIKVSLIAYKGKQVQVGVATTCKHYVYTFLDKMEIKEDLAHNLGIAEVSAPEFVKPNDEFAVSVDVENRGANTESNYTVEFYRDGASTPFKTINGVSIAPGAIATYNVGQTLTFNDGDAQAKYHAVINFAGDEYQNDNTSSQITVNRKYSDKPNPTNLTATRSGGDVNLAWTAPAAATQRFASSQTETCEDFTSWAYENVGEWTFIDGDQAEIGGFQNIDLPNNPLKSKRAFFVFDNTDEAFNGSFDAHSGTKYLAAMFRYDDGTTDDWAISPILSGNAQTISLWARSYSASYPEKMELLYSTTGKATTDFTSVQTIASVPATWTEYTFEVPAGAKYFAIRSCATGSFLLMVDDITFESTPDVVVGYNVYRDNVKINSEMLPATQTTYKDASIGGDHVYHVTALYASGAESAPTNGAHSGVQAIENGVTIEAGNGFIAIAGAEGKLVAIIDMKGAMLFNGVADNEVRIEVAPGVYMVRVANGTVKVIVK